MALVASTTLLLLFTFAVCINGEKYFLHGRFWNGFLTNIKRQDFLSRDRDFPDLWFDQVLDHTNSSLGTWKQRYFINNNYYRPGGPVFIQIGGEGEANPIWMSHGFWIEEAKRVGAMCFLLEHRYYGKSHPTKDLSSENLRWLSSEQALADLASFRVAMAKTHGLEHAKWVTFGGSYPGSLSAWFRLKYPQYVDVAVSSSAPLQAVVDFSEYNVVVGQSIVKMGGQSCYYQVGNATAQVARLLEHPVGGRLLSGLFKTCKPLDITNKHDVANFVSTLAGNFDGIVQYNRDNRAFEGGSSAGITISMLCSIMANKSNTHLENYAAVNDLILSAGEQNCTDVKYTDFLDEMRNTSWNGPSANGMRQWTYQTCTEFGFYQTSDAKQQPFGSGFDADFYVNQCADIYGPDFSSARLGKGVSFTNSFYGAKGYNATKVIFINGGIDPWHALGMTSPSFDNDRLIIYIEGTAHCANMYPASVNDPPQLTEARKLISRTLSYWLA